MTGSTLAPPTTALQHAPSSPQRAAIVGVFVLLVVALLARTVFLLWEPPFDGAIRYDAVAPLGDAYWTMHLFVGGPASALAWVATAILVAQLARGRSAAATLVAALVIAVGGVLFALVITAEVLPFAYATDPAVLPEAEGRALVDTLNTASTRLVPAIVGSQAAIGAGVLVALVAGLVSRALPRTLAAAGLVFLVVHFAVPFDALPHAATAIADVVQSLLLAAIGWVGLRSAPHESRPTAGSPTN